MLLTTCVMTKERPDVLCCYWPLPSWPQARLPQLSPVSRLLFVIRSQEKRKYFIRYLMKKNLSCLLLHFHYYQYFSEIQYLSCDLWKTGTSTLFICHSLFHPEKSHHKTELWGVPSFIQIKVNIIQGVPVNKSQDGSQAADGAGNDWAGTLLHVWSQHVSWGQGTGCFIISF